MFRNVFYDTHTSTMHLWEDINGSREYTTIPWVPYFFQKSEIETGIRTLDGFHAKKRSFDSYKLFYDAQKEASNMYENQVAPSLQFLSEYYYRIADEDMPVPKLKTYSVDIEVHSDVGFPHPEHAEYPITVINVKEFGGKSYSWGLNAYNGPREFTLLDGTTTKLEYINCKNEPDLIKMFILWFNKHTPDVLTGYNIAADNKTNRYGGFDLHYLVNRCIKLFGEDTTIFNKLSPIGKFRKWSLKETGAMMFDVAGMSVIDYMALYMWYTPKNQENYRLETICQDELGIGKMDYSSYGNLRDLYKKNWDKYIEYNVIDNIRIEELEQKLGYIKLAQSLSLLCKTPLKSYNASVQQIEGLLLTHYRRNDLCAPYFAGGSQEWFPAAYVKDPEKGLHNWVIDIDITSSYPTSIIIMNMSPETYMGRVSLSESQVLECCKKKTFDIPFQFVKTTGISKMEGEKLSTFTKLYQKKMITVAPCGTVFDNTKKGVYASVEKAVFFKRKEVKKMMIDVKKEAAKCKDNDPEKHKALKEKADQYFSLQWALKIVLNQAFGVLAVPYCRYFNTNIAEAITSCSKNTIIEGQNFVNRLLNDPSKSSEFEVELNNIIEEINKS